MAGVLDAPVVAARVLIVEDDPTVAEVVARYLLREGYQVETVADGAVGLERALADPPDLVVLDLMLPSLGGLELCRRLRAVAPVPVIMLTARGEEADRIAALDPVAGRAEVWVQDGCGGIPEGDLGQVFELAYRGDAARSRTPVDEEVR